MHKIDDLVQETLRDWQIRRLEVKDRMQSHPEKILELSRVLDLMDEEHAAILGGSVGNPALSTCQRDSTIDQIAAVERSLRPSANTFELQLHVTASNPDHLRKLLEIAVYELQRQIDGQKVVAAGECSRHPGGMSGTLGAYHFELDVNGGVNHG